jgi:hypothetical protein
MIVHQLCGPPAPALAQALASFEEQFSYPLGPGRSFRISHGEDYPRFFRAIGEARCFVAEQEGRVVGALGVAVRRLLLPDGSERTTGYIGDLKVAMDARGSLVFLRLVRAGDQWVRPKVTAAFGVVMDGTATTPTAYTGRVGIPAFRELGKVMIWRLPADGLKIRPTGEWLTTENDRALACYRRLSQGRYASVGGTSAERSEIVPQWLLHPDGLACGLLEDTRRGKRLIADDGSEMRSAHLSFFAFRTPEAGAALIQVARSQVARAGLPAMFVSVAVPDVEALGNAVGPIEKVVAPATIYGAELAPGPAWNINTSEI